MITERPETPLQEIERVVQQRAKDDSLDLAASGADQTLSRLVDEEIQAWNSDHLHGLRPYPIDDSGTIAERAMRNLTGYGPLAPLLEDDDVWEVIIKSFATCNY